MFFFVFCSICLTVFFFLVGFLPLVQDKKTEDGKIHQLCREHSYLYTTFDLTIPYSFILSLYILNG